MKVKTYIIFSHDMARSGKGITVNSKIIIKMHHVCMYTNILYTSSYVFEYCRGKIWKQQHIQSKGRKEKYFIRMLNGKPLIPYGRKSYVNYIS